MALAVLKRFLAKNGVDNNSNTLVNVADPVNAQDAATKAYATNASNLASGTVPTARLGSGTASSVTYLRGDGTWATPAGGGGGGSATTAYTRTTFTPTAGQTTFTAAYTVDFLNVYVNGAMLAPADVTATNGTSFTIAAVSATDVVECIAYNVAAIDVTNASSLAVGTVPTARLGSGTANNTTYLRGDQTWATLTQVTPGAPPTSVQYNNGAGGFAGTDKVCINQGHLELSDITSIPTPPAADKLLMFAENHAGRMLLSAMGPSGVDYNFQTALFGNNVCMWFAGATTPLSIGVAFTGTGQTQTLGTKATTSALASMNRNLFPTGTTATNGAGLRSGAAVAWMGNAANLGGFLFFARIGLEALSGTYRLMVGLTTISAQLTGEPSALANSVLLCKDTTDTTWQLSVRGAAAGQKINTGITVAVGQLLDVFMYSAPNSQVVQVQVKDPLTNTDLYVSPVISTNVPANTALLLMHAQILSVTGTTSKQLALNRLYCETDL